MRTIISLHFILFYTLNGISQLNSKVTPAFHFLTNYNNIRDFTMNESEDEAYITIQSFLEETSIIAIIRKFGNAWSEPEMVSFSGKYKDLEPFLSPNGLKLFFVSNRPLLIHEKEIKDFDIWYVQRETLDSKWSEPKNLGAPVNTENNEFYPAIASNNNLYYTSDGPNSKGKDDIMFCKWENDTYSSSKSLSDSINTSEYEYNAFIAPDESYLLFGAYNRPDGFGSGDIYISFKKPNKEWGKAINLGPEINSKFMDYCPFVSSHKNTLYFTSRRSSIESINNFESIKEFNLEIQKYQNGMSRLYKVGFDSIKISKF